MVRFKHFRLEIGKILISDERNKIREGYHTKYVIPLFFWAGRYGHWATDYVIVNSGLCTMIARDQIRPLYHNPKKNNRIRKW